LSYYVEEWVRAYTLLSDVHFLVKNAVSQLENAEIKTSLANDTPERAMTFDRTTAFEDRVSHDAWTLVQHHLRLRREVIEIQDAIKVLLAQNTVESWMIMCLVAMCKEYTIRIQQLYHGAGLARKFDRVADIIELLDKSGGCGVHDQVIFANLKKLLKAFSFYEAILPTYFEEVIADSFSSEPTLPGSGGI
jgi:hypothetical protein